MLEGSVRRAGTRLRITVQLIDVADGFHLWAERYDREMADVFAVQDESMPRMKAAALRAVGLDETLAVAHVRLGDARCFRDWDWAGAEREFLRALELDPDSSEALCRYGLFLWGRLRNAEALACLQRALDVDPFSLDANWFHGWVHLSLGHLDEAEDVARRMISMDPHLWIGHQLLAWVESVRGRWAEALQAYERSAAIEGGPASLSVLSWCYQKGGRPAEARQVLERLERLATTRIVPATWLALAYDGVGADAQARAHMELAIAERHMLLVHLRGYITTIGWLSTYLPMLDERGL